MKKIMCLLATAAAVSVAAPAMSSETISVVFTQADGGVTSGLYSGQVQVNVVGTGFSAGSANNDAFYLYDGVPTHNPSYYQLTYGLTTLVPFDPAQNAVNFIVGGLPAYSASHDYTFILNTGAAIGSVLHFGVGDGNFGDNGGGFRVTITQLGAVPEPASWALMIGGFALAGGALRSHKRQAASFA